MSDLSKINFGGTEYNIKDTTARTDVAKKVTASGGDTSNTKISSETASTESFPVPAAGETHKTILGKVIKFFNDVKAFKNTVVTLNMISQQIINDQNKVASMAALFSVNETVTQLNRDFNSNKTVKNSLPNAHFLAFAWDNARPDGKFYVTVDQTIFPIALKDDLTLKTGTVAVTSYITDGTVYLERAGNVVHLYCRWDLTLTGSPGTGVTLFTVPDGFRPYRTHRTLAQLDYNIGVRQLEIATSGAASLQGSGAGNATSLLFDAVYFTN